MGLLTDIRNGKRGASSPGSIIFWFVAATGLGVGTLWVLTGALSESGLRSVALPAGVLGLAIGFYAAWGTSAVARALALPGTIVNTLMDLIS
jgi:hypothetical protein